MLESKKSLVKKVTIELDVTDELQKTVYEKIIYRTRKKYRTQTEYILAALCAFEDPVYPVVHIADQDKEQLIQEFQKTIHSIRQQPGI